MTATTTAASRTISTSDPWIREMKSPPHWRYRLQIPRAVLAAQGHQQVAQTLAAYDPQHRTLEALALGRCAFLVFGSMRQASAAALRGFAP